MAARAQYPNRVVVPGLLSVYDGREEGLDTDGGRWSVVCERHGTIMTVETLWAAKAEARSGVADFCEECMAALHARS